MKRALVLVLLCGLSGCKTGSADYGAALALVGYGLLWSGISRASGGCYAICTGIDVCNPESGFCERSGCGRGPGCDGRSRCGSPAAGGRRRCTGGRRRRERDTPHRGVAGEGKAPRSAAQPTPPPTAMARGPGRRAGSTRRSLDRRTGRRPHPRRGRALPARSPPGARRASVPPVRRPRGRCSWRRRAGAERGRGGAGTRRHRAGRTGQSRGAADRRGEGGAAAASQAAGDRHRRLTIAAAGSCQRPQHEHGHDPGAPVHVPPPAPGGHGASSLRRGAQSTTRST